MSDKDSDHESGYSDSFDSPEKNGPTTSHKTDLNASNMSRRSSDSSFNVEQDEEDDGASRSQSVGGPPRSASNTGAEEPSQSDSAESESKPPPPPMDSDPPEEKAAKVNDEGNVADDSKEHEDHRPAAPRMTGSAQASPTKAPNRSHPNGHRSQSKDEPTDKHHNNNHKKGGSNNNNNKSEPKMAKYAVEDPRFAPNHAPINDTQLEGLVHRLYDPEPLRRRTLQSVEQRAQQAAAKHYNSMQDSHLAAFWFKKQQKSPGGLLSVTDETHGGVGGGRAPPAGSDPNATFPSPSRGGRHRELQPLMLRPATCPLEEDLTALCLTPRERRRYLRRKQEGGSEAAAPPRSQSMMEGGHAASSAARREQPLHHHDDNDSPEWKEQRGSAKSPQRQQGTVTRQAAAAPTPLPVVSLVIGSSEDPAIREGWLQSLLCSVVQQEEGANKATAGSDAGSSPRRKLYQPSSPRASEHASVTSSMKSWLNVADVKRKDLSAIWMAACPPSAYQRLVARLNLSTKQFKLGWLLQGGDPPPGGTIMEIPPEAPAQDDSSCHVLISSPRSVYVLLRLGLSSEDLAPVTLNAHYCDASLKGIPPHVAEVHFAARERQRQRQLQEAVRGYADVCSQITQREFVERLQQCNPEANRHALLSREAEPVRGRPESLSGSRRRSSVDGSAADPEERGAHRQEEHSANDEDEDSSQPPEDDAQAAKNRIEQSRVKQQTRQDKYLKQLARNADLMKKQTMMAQQREQLQKEKHQELLQRRQEELAERKRKQQERAEKLERIRQEAKQSELDRQQNLLKRIEEDEKRSYKLAEVRHEAHMLKQEERKIHQENKIEKVIRREKQMDYQNLLTLDRIRRKAGRAEAMQEMRHAAQKELKELRERNAVEMSQKTELFAKELLEYQRKSLQ